MCVLPVKNTQGSSIIQFGGPGGGGGTGVMVTVFFHYKTWNLAFCSIDTVVKVFTIAQEMTDSLKKTQPIVNPRIFNTPELCIAAPKKEK